MTKEQVLMITDMADKFNQEPVKTRFEDMILQLKIFFREEEKLYRKYEHPDTDQHVKIHNELERVAAYFEESYFNRDEKTQSVLDEFCLYIKNWTMLHVECYDKSMMPYIRIEQYIEETAA